MMTSEPAADGDGIRPTLAELVALRAEVLATWPARRGSHGIQGVALAPLRGRGMEYAESREYAPGDDARHMDWRVTARTGRPHSKLFQPERERLSLIVADNSPALHFGTRTRYKSVQAARLGAAGVWAAVRDGDRVAALCSMRTEPPVMPVAGTRGAWKVLDALVRWYAQPPEEDAGLTLAIEHARRLLRPGSRAFVLADAAAAAAISPESWVAMTHHAEVHLLLPVDAFEQTPPPRALPLQVAAGRRTFDFASLDVRKQWHEAFHAPIDALRTMAHRCGFRLHVITTAQSSKQWLASVFGTQMDVA